MLMLPKAYWNTGLIIYTYVEQDHWIYGYTVKCDLVLNKLD